METTKSVVKKSKTVDLPTLSTEQLDLVKRTIAPGATPDELQLFLYDCVRQHVHPLDKLLHFTKRKDNNTGLSRYTPIGSIDLFRSRAEETGEYAGSDEPIFEEKEGLPSKCTVTVYRIVKGVRCSFTAAGFWKEYYPGEKMGFMYRAKPHLMLSKCVEALALRKAFPRQLSQFEVVEESYEPTADRAEEATAVVQVEKMTTATTVPITTVEVEAVKPKPPPNVLQKESSEKPFDPSSELVGFGTFSKHKWITLPIEALEYFIKNSKTQTVVMMAKITLATLRAKNEEPKKKIAGLTDKEFAEAEESLDSLKSVGQAQAWFDLYDARLKNSPDQRGYLMGGYRTKLKELKEITHAADGLIAE